METAPAALVDLVALNHLLHPCLGLRLWGKLDLGLDHLGSVCLPALDAAFRVLGMVIAADDSIGGMVGAQVVILVVGRH